MSEISVLGIDAASLLSITLWAFSELEISMSFSFAAAITALPPHCQKNCLNEAQHRYIWSEKYCVYHYFSHSSLSLFLYLPHAVPIVYCLWKTTDFRVPAHGYVQGYVQVLLMDMYKLLLTVVQWRGFSLIQVKEGSGILLSASTCK